MSKGVRERKREVQRERQGGRDREKKREWQRERERGKKG